MLDTIKNVILGIADMFTSVFDFLIGLVEDIVYVIKLCTSFVTKIPAYFAWLPSEAVAIVVVIFSVVVLYKVMGREG